MESPLLFYAPLSLVVLLYTMKNPLQRRTPTPSESLDVTLDTNLDKPSVKYAQQSIRIQKTMLWWIRFGVLSNIVLLVGLMLSFCIQLYILNDGVGSVKHAIVDANVHALSTQASLTMQNAFAMSQDPIQYTLGAEAKQGFQDMSSALSEFFVSNGTDSSVPSAKELVAHYARIANKTASYLENAEPRAERLVEHFLAVANSMMKSADRLAFLAEALLPSAQTPSNN
jgi:hypothetical protein